MALTLDARLSSQLRELALSHEASLFMVLAALLQVQMHLLSGQADVVIGTPVAGRQRLELEPQVGFYLNLLPLHAQRMTTAGCSRPFSPICAASCSTPSHTRHTPSIGWWRKSLAPGRLTGTRCSTCC